MSKEWKKTHLVKDLPFFKSFQIADQDDSYEEHEKGMGGYDVKSLSSTEELLNKYFYGFQMGRLERSYKFITECNLGKEHRMVSLGCGACALETRLVVDGCSVDVTDVGKSSYMDQYLKLLPEVKFYELDVLNAPDQTGSPYDVVLAISLIYFI